MIYLKQSTAKTLRVGPFLDEDDGKTAENALTISQADIRLSKSGGAFAQTNDASGATNDENGWYSLQLNATDTGTVGPLKLAIHESGALPVFEDYMVLPANVYDSLVAGTDTLESDLIQIGGVAQSATDLKDFADAGYDPATNKVQGVVLTDTTTTNTDMVGTDGALLAANVNVAAGVVESNLIQIGGVAQSATDLKDFADAGYDPATNKVQGVVLTDTTTTNTDMRGTDSAALATGVQLSAQGKTDVNNEVADVLKTDTNTEQGAGAPPATPTFEEAIMYLYQLFIVKRDQSATLQRIYKSDGTLIAKATVGQAGGTTTRQNFVAP